MKDLGKLLLFALIGVLGCGLFVIFPEDMGFKVGWAIFLMFLVYIGSRIKN